MFYIWWTYACDWNNGTDADKAARVRTLTQAVIDVRNKIDVNDKKINTSLIGARNTLQAALTGNQSLKAGTEPKFFTQRDPTVMVAGLRSAWPTTSSDGTWQVRLDSQNTYLDGELLSSTMSSIKAAMSAGMATPIGRLIVEAEDSRGGTSRNLDFVSSPLTGLTDQLITRMSVSNSIDPLDFKISSIAVPSSFHTNLT